MKGRIGVPGLGRRSPGLLSTGEDRTKAMLTGPGPGSPMSARAGSWSGPTMTTEIDGVAVIDLRSEAAGGLEAAVVPGAGMVVCSLRHHGDELLGQRRGLRAYIEERATMGIPLLYPWANRVASDRFEVAGRRVDLDRAAPPPPRRDSAGLAMHGLLSGAHGWRVDHHDGGTVRASFDFGAQAGLIEAFPFPHRVLYEAALRGSTLSITTTVEASAGSPVPVAFGYHPYFRLPGSARERLGGRDPRSRAAAARRADAADRRARAGGDRDGPARRAHLRRRVHRATGRAPVLDLGLAPPHRGALRRGLPIRPGLRAR